MVKEVDAGKNALSTQKKSRVGSSFNRQFINWLGWKVLLPLVVISLLYPLIKYILEIPNSFGKAFAHGDLLVFSALVLLEAATEGEQDQEQSTKMQVGRIVAKVAAIAAIIAFVATKFDILRKESDLAAHGGSHDLLTKKMLAYSCLNCTVALFAVVGSTLLFWFNVDREKKHEFESLAQPEP